MRLLESKIQRTHLCKLGVNFFFKFNILHSRSDTHYRHERKKNQYRKISALNELCEQFEKLFKCPIFSMLP